MAIATPAPQRAAGRRKLADAGKALPDGSFPMPNLDYLRKAIRAVGRAAPGKRPALARLIRKRASQLGSAGMAVLKGSWADKNQSAKAMANALYGQLIELGFDPELAKAETKVTMSFMLIELATPVVGSTDGPQVTTLASGKSKPKKWDPDNDGDNDASPAGDTDNDMAGKLGPHGRAAMRKALARKMTLAAAHRVGRTADKMGSGKAA